MNASIGYITVAVGVLAGIFSQLGYPQTAGCLNSIPTTFNSIADHPLSLAAATLPLVVSAIGARILHKSQPPAAPTVPTK